MLYNIFDFAVCNKSLFMSLNKNKELNTLNSLMSLSVAAAEVVNDRVNVDGNWGLIGSTVATGIVIVFLILAILIFFLWVMGKIFQTIENAKTKKAKKAIAETVAAPAPVSAPAAAEVYEEDEDDDEIIAVISAAIAAYGEAEGKQYRISSVKKREKSQRSGWSAAGVAENMRGF